MKKIFVSIFIFLSITMNAQPIKYVDYVAVPVEAVDDTRCRAHLCVDSLGNITDACDLGVLPMRVEFFRAYLNRNTMRLMLIGRTLSPSAIYLSRGGNNIFKDSLLSFTSKQTDTLSDHAGFFDVVFPINKATSIRFYCKDCNYAEYNVGELLNQAPKRWGCKIPKGK